MKNSIFILSIIFLSSVICPAQTQFQLAIGGGNDYAGSIIQTTDGGYAAAGWTYSFGNSTGKCYFNKLDGNGTQQWNKIVIGPTGDVARSIIQTTDGGYAVTGYSQTGTSNEDVYIMKLDGSGGLLWSKLVGGTGLDYGYSIVRTTDGSYAVGGSTRSYGMGQDDFFILKLDGTGTLLWNKVIGGTNIDIAFSITKTTDGGYAAAGLTRSYGAGNADFYIVKIDGAGTIQWSKTIGGTGNEECFSIIQSTDGGYTLAGYTQSFGAGLRDCYIVKLDGNGALQWTRTIGGTGNDEGNSIVQTTDGGYAVAGYTESFGAGLRDCYIVKLDGNGTLQWSRTIGGSSNDFAYSIVQTTDGGYCAAGWTSSFGGGNTKCYILKLDASGNSCGNTSAPTSISGTGGTLGSPTPTVNTPTPTVSLPSPTTNTGGTVTNICTATGILPVSNEIPNSFQLYQNYPNPFNPSTEISFKIAGNENVSLKVYDINGKEVATLISNEMNAGNYEITFDANKLSSGVYFYKLVTNEFSDTKRMMLVK